MLYFDTSFLVPLLIPEETSMRIEGFFHHLPPEEMLAVSQWTRIEFASVLSRLVRMRQFDLHVARECAERFTRLLDESFNIIAPGEGDFGRCWDFLVRFDNGLRAGDALHLAIAENHGAEKIYTLDNGLLAAGKLLKLPVDRGITL